MLSSRASATGTGGMAGSTPIRATALAPRPTHANHRRTIRAFSIFDGLPGLDKNLLDDAARNCVGLRSSVSTSVGLRVR